MAGNSDFIFPIFGTPAAQAETSRFALNESAPVRIYIY
jgi:hypothetical protein